MQGRRDLRGTDVPRASDTGGLTVKDCVLIQWRISRSHCSLKEPGRDGDMLSDTFVPGVGYWTKTMDPPKMEFPPGISRLTYGSARGRTCFSEKDFRGDILGAHLPGVPESQKNDRQEHILPRTSITPSSI